MFRPSLPRSTSISFSPHSALDEDRAHSPTSPTPLTPLSEDAPIHTIPYSAIRNPMSDTNDITLHSKPIPTKTKRTEDEKEQRRTTLVFQNLVLEQEEAENHINTDGPWACYDDSQSEFKTLRGTQMRKRHINHLTINTTLAQAYKPYQALPLIDTHSENHHQSEESAGSSPVEGSEESESNSPATSPLVVASYRDEDGLVEESVADANEDNDSDDETNGVGTDFEIDGILHGRESQRGSRAVRKCESAQVPSSVRDFADGLLCQSESERDSEDDDERSIPSSPDPSLMAREIDELDLDLEMDFVVVDSDADVDEDDLEEGYGGVRGVGQTKVLTGCVGRTKAGIDDGSLRLEGMVWESVCSAGGEGEGDVGCVRRC